MSARAKFPTRYFGDKGEKFAKKFLYERGYKILTTKFRCRFGEIDIVALKDGVLVFIEVKTRWSEKFGKPEEAVTPWKLQRIKRTAEYFSLLNSNLPKKLLIEVVAIEVREERVTKAKIITVD
ncbi:hypothetical protein A2V56_00525 [Candidatus Woesebacteria bacterium RBG_19FT_COMBO_42_9]|uniref:UPF0102 protein A2V97_00105 n=1 Tax=Candidatus Woesebacteria bacterium RBG_16_42_24 TaxID=1802485 RepID=A0A1F7XJA4_9BACT|nr:MAG: hypothetical protein A2V97_00105 [Candidatus Woesebacteria bacterium RBG_16_42_24]OGM17480.1 MAG: hypothetical protein A2V56_00525 [Candidatus Woesebacteria bacterium RBG_19FT_COMBO_42_9]OGM67120.1 MAG: hypothetical protein A2985_02625 [Candidatus Woesebacteria bacterium RIFCSPLOWO2_01_FULL_43_11]